MSGKTAFSPFFYDMLQIIIVIELDNRSVAKPI